MLLTHFWRRRLLWSLLSTLDSLIEKVKLLAQEMIGKNEALDSTLHLCPGWSLL